MKIIGFGSDIVNINRIKKLIKKNNLFKKRVFSIKEIIYCEKKKNNFSCYAKRFAAKEAFSKAVGTGISRGMSFNEIEVSNNKKGKPSINIKGKTLVTVKKMLKTKKMNILLTLSDDFPFALAAILIVK